MKVLQGGIQTLVEDFPGRLGYLELGVSPAGALDNVALGLGNILVGNQPGEAGLEITVGLFACEFDEDTVIAITGADLGPTINNQPVSMWRSLEVNRGDVLQFGGLHGNGFRAYICFAGGINVPLYLGSKSTCLCGGYGGFQGRALKTGDHLDLGVLTIPKYEISNREVKANKIPEYKQTIELRMIPGMNAYPDYVTEEGMHYLYNTLHKFSTNCNRTACRLSQVPDSFFARESGGIGGSHPSNVIDHAYNMCGGINVTGNTPTILLADGPTMGGFICCGNVISADLWKVGQAVIDNDYAKFTLCTIEEAIAAREELSKLLSLDSIEVSAYSC